MTPLRQRLIEELKLRGLAENTIKSYVQAIARSARYFGRSPDQLSKEDLRKYLLHLREEKKVVIITNNAVTSAVPVHSVEIDLAGFR